MFTDKKITIIIYRNPYNRLISGYLNKYVEHSKYLEKFKKNCNDDISTFEKFVNHFYDNKLKFIDLVHFRSQLFYLNSKYINYVFDSENLSTFIKFLNNEINKLKQIYDFSKYEGVKHHNKYENSEKIIYNKLNREELLELIKKKKIPDYKFFYNKEITKKVDIIYANDIKFYNKYF